MTLCNIGGDPSLEPSDGGYVLLVCLVLVTIVYLISRRAKD